jgi:hypothetical protein
VVAAVAARGRVAANVLVARFHPDGAAIDPITDMPPDAAWERHRWTRLRSFLAGYEELGRKFLRAWGATPAAGRSFETLVREEPDEGWRYRWGSAEQSAWARTTAPALADAMAHAFPPGDAREAGHSFDLGDGVEAERGRSPRPKMVLRATPPRGTDPTDTFTPLGAAAPPSQPLAAGPGPTPPATA